MLSGVKVLDLTRYFPGPFATLRLVERGAEVIKIEEKTGDPARYMDRIDGSEGAVFRCMSRGKKSVSLDLKLESDREKFLSLADTADIVIESFRPGVTKRLGIDHESLKTRNPSIVYISITGFGQKSSLSHLGSHDLNYMAISGVLDQLRDKNGELILPTLAMADLVSGLCAEEAALTGYVQRLRTGKGSHIDVAMADAMVSLMQLVVTKHSATGELHGLGNYGLGKNLFETKDNKYIAMCAVEEKFFSNFCRAVGKEHLIPHQKEAPVPGNASYEEMAALFRERSFEEWGEFSTKVDCCMTPVLSAAELKDNQYIKERGLIENKWGLDYVATRFFDNRSFLEYDRPYPKIGEDNYICDAPN